MIVSHEKLETSIDKRCKVTFGYYKFWRASLNDGLYYANGALLLPVTNNERHVADMYDINIAYSFTGNITVQLISTYAKRGKFLIQSTQTPGNIYYAGLRTNILF